MQTADRHLALTPPQRTLSIGAVVVATFGVGVSYGIGYPLTALTFEAWGAEPWVTGLVGAAPALAIFLLLPVFPKLVARLGTVPSMALGCVLVAAGFLLMPLFPSPEAWFVLRFMMGAGLALPWLVGETWINTIATNATRGRMVAIYSMSLFTGFALGPVILGQTGTTGWAPFMVGAAGIVLAVLPILAAAKLAPDMPAHPQTGVLGAVRLAPVAMIAAALGGLIEIAGFSMLPVWAGGVGLAEADALWLLTLFMLGGVALQLPVGWLADRFSAARTTVILASVVVALVTLIPLLAAGLPLAVGVFLLGGVGVGFYTLGIVAIGQTVRAQDLAVANAAFLMAYQAGAMAGPAAAGAATQVWETHGLLVTLAVAAAVSIVAILSVGARRRAA